MKVFKLIIMIYDFFLLMRKINSNSFTLANRMENVFFLPNRNALSCMEQTIHG